MGKYLKLSSVVLTCIVGVSCYNNSDFEEVTEDKVIIESFDHTAQLHMDRDSLYKYLSSHYYNTNDGLMWNLSNEEIGALSTIDRLPLNQDPKLDSIEGIEALGITKSYKMYYYIEGKV